MFRFRVLMCNAVRQLAVGNGVRLTEQSQAPVVPLNARKCLMIIVLLVARRACMCLFLSSLSPGTNGS